ncbi:tripartite tricarboxylate transporter permease [Oleisolibacter albus]|uniref:tripartite tricarboxylate transporter permease n=1 Tax=Oleisolibacter albus TaxID=2171757 RepID=UPI000DF1A125|nr:tripartite tricarboxylate transporter permease [Oleisolibacter albus]
MDQVFSNLALGFGAAVTPINLGLCFIGALVGTLIGVLPGLGPIATIAILLPITFYLDPLGALIMLAGIYYGAQYGGSTTAILVNMPGETSSVVTTLDGHQMARQGRAGPALAIAALGSFFAGSVATFLVALFGPLLAGIAQKFGPAEYFSLMLTGLVGATVLASGSVVKAVAMILVGLLLGSVGSDIETGEPRMTFGIPQIAEGINFTTLAVGLFGIAEILRNLEKHAEDRSVLGGRIIGLMPTWRDIKQSALPVLRGTGIGSVLGILPGNGAVLAPYASYTLEKKLSKTPSRFGKGAIEGVAGPESANNAGAQTSFIPLLTLGIPPNAVMAMMVGAMTMQGIIPGPTVMTENPTLFWGMIASMWIGNAMLVIINLPLVGIWVRLLRVPYRLLFPAILLFCCIGVYTINSSHVDVLLVALFGLVGYFLLKHGFEPAPLLLAFVLGPLLEENLRRALLIARGDPAIFITRPISAFLLLVAVGLLAVVLLPSVRKRREEVFHEED